LVTIEDPVWEEPKTSRMSAVIDKLGLAGKRCLLVLAGTDENIVKSARNLPGLRTINAEELCAYDVVDAYAVIITERGLERLREVRGF